MFKVYPTKMKAMIGMHKEFETQAEAKDYVASRKNPDNYTIESMIPVNEPETSPTAPKTEKANWKQEIDFSGSVEITQANVKYFYEKSGYIQVTSANGNVLHVGKTKNMGKVFSNYLNCAKYNQSYDFNLRGGDRLFFKESAI